MKVIQVCAATKNKTQLWVTCSKLECQINILSQQSWMVRGKKKHSKKKQSPKSHVLCTKADWREGTRWRICPTTWQTTADAYECFHTQRWFSCSLSHHPKQWSANFLCANFLCANFLCWLSKDVGWPKRTLKVRWLTCKCKFRSSGIFTQRMGSNRC